MKPRNRDKPHRPNAEQIKKLLTGFALFDGYAEETQRAAWDEHREWLLYIWQHPEEYEYDPAVEGPHDTRTDFKGPGTRPWAWWRYDAPEPRRRIRGEGESGADNPEAHPEWTRKRWFGIPAVWAWLDPQNPPVYEGEGVYLDRLGLLSDEERERLKGQDLQNTGHHSRIPGCDYDDDE